MRALRLLATTVMVVALLQLGVSPATAAPPGNDEVSGAVVLHVRDRVVLDTSEATTTARDQALNEGCGAPATTASVWYAFTPVANRNVLVDVTSSDYSAGVLVFRGTPSAGRVVACDAGVVGFSARAGVTYYIMAISDSAVPGGRLVLSLRPAPPPPRVHVTVARPGLAYRGGAARIHGRFSCTGGNPAMISGTLVQRAGRLKIPAAFDKEVRCDGRRHAWSARVVSETGTYARGTALARVTIFACGMFACREDSARRHVRLRQAHRPSGHRSMAPRVAPVPRPRPLVERQMQDWGRPSR